MNAVRMGEFIWGLCEPREGEYDFSWLRRVMDLMGLGCETEVDEVWYEVRERVMPMERRKKILPNERDLLHRLSRGTSARTR